MLPLSVSCFVSTLLIGPLFDKVGRKWMLLTTCTAHWYRLCIWHLAHLQSINYYSQCAWDIHLLHVLLFLACIISSQPHRFRSVSHKFTYNHAILYVHRIHPGRYLRRMDRLWVCLCCSHDHRWSVGILVVPLGWKQKSGRSGESLIVYSIILLFVYSFSLYCITPWSLLSS